MKKPVVSLIREGAPGWRWLADRIDAVDWHFHDIPQQRTGSRGEKLARLARSLKAVFAARHSDLILSFGPGNAAAIELARRILRVSVPHANYFFNYTPLPPPAQSASRGKLLADIGLLVVSAESERTQYAQHFGLNPAILETVLWGVGMPVVDTAYTVPAGPYVCSIGGNNRDYPMLLAAAALLPDTRFLIVARPVNMVGLTVPANVEVRTNIPFEAAMAVIAGAEAIILPMADRAVAAGHVTIVNAFLLETPVIATEAPGIADYVINGQTGILTVEHDAKAMADAITALLNDPARRKAIAATARTFALERCSEQNYIDHLPKVVERLRRRR
ncbi:glycosyltransferase [Sphingomonas mollis]|uniref:Glycosyltransferase n=1 Tax=Sphingomonas mollis TaxID=2795726 RepID=A0ABS0XSV6_9SPHN|nr:glycosyltransferase [Sphingomonas sp. BT553]MBJ6123113.1 glycosyltransferase [Sphingomonas sp. BT553]